MASDVHQPVISRHIKTTLRVARARKNLTWAEVSERLAAMGIHQTAGNLASKYSRGEMQAELFLALLVVFEATDIQLPELAAILGG